MRFNKGVQEPVFAHKPPLGSPRCIGTRGKHNYQLGGDVYL